jgi:hypothetical protein
MVGQQFWPVERGKTSMAPVFDELQQAFTHGGAQAALASLAQQLTAAGQFHELFEALKMQLRVRLGLPIVASSAGADDLSESLRSQLEEGLLEACRHVGTLLLQKGRIREGWMYLRPVGDRTLAAQLLAAIEPDEDNLEELIEVLLHEGVDCGRGFQLLLAHNGVCNAITTYDQLLSGRSRQDRQAAAAALLTRLHADLVANVTADVVRQENSQPTEKTLAGLLADRDWLFHDGAYHIDTTHLASVVRMARVLEESEQLSLARDLTCYGQRLAPQLQYPGDEPFVDQYPSHALYYSALLGEQVDEAVAYFQNKATLLDSQYHGTEPLEVYLELLNRLGRPAEALAEACQKLPSQVPFAAYAPVLLELSQKAGDSELMQAFCRSRNDLLGFTVALLGTAATK